MRIRLNIAGCDSARLEAVISSFGENELSVNSRIVGRMRVLDVYQGSALYPRLTFRLGVSLQDHPSDTFSPGRPIKGYEIRDLRGELRLEEGAKALGILEWTGPRRYVRSATHAFESQVELVCDFDWARLETIEEYRAGNQPTLWLALWPTLVDGKGSLDCDIRPVRAQVPRDRWIETLAQLTGVRRTLIEIVLPTIQAPEFKAAVGHVEEARRRVDRGDFDEAVAACRRAIESMSAALNVPNEVNALEKKLAGVTDAKRAKAYAGIVARVKDLGNVTIHRPEGPGSYLRAEAQFVVAVTSQMLGLLASLLRPDSQ
jgi:hypothetical protein